jgi:3-oxoadipate enol-lactonase
MSRPALVFRDDGPRDAPAVVLLHALATHQGLWSPQRPVWQRALRLISIDLPGHGQSPHLAHADNLEAMAQEVLAVIDFLGLDRVAVVGLSLGGMLAQALALQHGPRISALVIAHATARTDPTVREIWNQRIAQFEAGSRDDLCASTLQRWFPRDFAEQSPLTMAWVADMIRSTSAAGYVSAIRAIQGLDHWDRLPHITAPALVVAGQADAAVPITLARQLVERLPQGRLCELEGTGHLGNLQSPTRFTEVVGGFLLDTLQPSCG